MEVEEQDPFLNTVAVMNTNQSPKEIQVALQSIEQTLKKDPPFRFGPRTIDLDILLYDDLVQEENDLSIPHPRMHQRRFVLEPLCELIDSEKKHPVTDQTWKELLDATMDQDCTKTAIPL